MSRSHLLAASAIVVIGMGSGVLARQLPVRPIAQSAAAGLASWILGSLVGVALRLVEPARQAGIAAVSVGLAEAAFGCAFAIGTGLALYIVLGWLGSVVHPAFASWRYLLIGFIGAVAGLLAHSGEPMTGPPSE